MNGSTSLYSLTTEFLACQGSQPHLSPLQAHTPTTQFFHLPQTSYHIPHQEAPRTLGRVCMDPSTLSVPLVMHHRSIMGHQCTLSNDHLHLHAVHSPSFIFSRPMGSPIPENMHHVAYISLSMMTSLPPHAPIYSYQNDLVPTYPHIFPPIASSPTSPIYPHALTNTSPPPNFISTL